MEVICSWEHICQRGCGSRPGIKIAQPGPRRALRSQLLVRSPEIHTLLLFGVASDTPLSRISSVDITSYSKNAPGLGSKGTASVLYPCPGEGQPCHESQTLASNFPSS